MIYRTLGRTGLRVSEIGYGAWGIGGNQWRGVGDDESLAALRRAIELGVNFIDTALAYNEGHSERLIGQVLRESKALVATTRAAVSVATKIPPKNRVWPAMPGTPISEVFPYDYSIACTETSLRNLGVETIDVQQFHVWNPEWLASPQSNDEWRRAIEDLKRAGKVRYFGISINAHEPDSALEAIETGLIDTVQVIYNIFDQTPEANLFPLCEARNIGVLARVPLDEGALTGTISEDSVFEDGDFRAHYFRGERKREVVERVNALVKDLGTDEPIAETALRFCLSHPAVSTVIPGMRKIRNVEANCRVSDVGPLSSNLRGVVRKHAWNKNYYR
ncbi:MAG: aldo/keto reductase [Bryobacteraceae bacterium]|nr:aldo/keto reductase [Bryobacteraceae bacterium]